MNQTQKIFEQKTAKVAKDQDSMPFFALFASFCKNIKISHL